MASPHRLLPPKKGDSLGGLVFEEVLGEVKHSKGNVELWRLRCSCGAAVDKKSSYVRDSQRKNRLIRCDDYQLNHARVKVGEKYGLLTIRKLWLKRYISPNGEKQKQLMATCDCDCGNKNIEGLARSLYTFNKKCGTVNRRSCGCLRAVFAEERKDPFSGTKEKEIWENAKRRSKERDLPFNLDVSDIVIPEICPVLGIPIKPNTGHNFMNDNSPTLDKFIPSKGYVKGNVHVISWRANNLKSDGLPEEWIKIAKWCEKETIKKKLEK